MSTLPRPHPSPTGPAPGPSPQSPPDRPSPRPPRRDADPSASSPTGSSAASDTPWAADPGPAFEPDTAPAAPELDPSDELITEEVRWEETQIRDALELQGEILHSLVEWRFALEETDVWLHTQKDLRAMAPPLTRILNRYDVTRAAAAAGDEALLAAAVIRYGSRNVMRTRRAMARRVAQGPQPVTGVPADPDTGPEYDPEYQRVNSATPFSSETPFGDTPPAIRPKGRR